MKHYFSGKNIKQRAEDFVEHSNAYLHAIFLFLVLFVSVACPYLGLQDPLTIIAELLVLIFMEILILQTKDAILQKKVNVIKVNTAIQSGALFKAADFGIDALQQFFSLTRNDFFVSGIALNGFMQRNHRRIEELIKDGKTVYILISDPASLDISVKYYYGMTKDKNQHKRWIRDMNQCVCRTLHCIIDSDILSKGMMDGKLKIRLSSAPFTTSFIARDIFHVSITIPAIQATFYQYGCTDTCEEPGIMVDSGADDYWYKRFQSAALKQWNDAREISGLYELTQIYDDVSKQI